MDRPGFTEHWFVSSVRPMRVIAFVAAAFIAVWTIVGFGSNWQMTAIVALGFALALSWIALELARLHYKVGVGEKGLYAYDWAGAYHTVEWGRITACRRTLLLPRLPYLVIAVGEQPNEVTVPIYLEHYARFRELVLSYAPADNPLSQFLAQRSDQKG